MKDITCEKVNHHFDGIEVDAWFQGELRAGFISEAYI
jgi:hypothetical protein